MPEPIELSFSGGILRKFRDRPQLFNKIAVMGGTRVAGMALGAFGAVWAARCLGPRYFGISGMVQNLVTQAILLINIIYPTVLIREFMNAPGDAARNHLIQVTNGFRMAAALFFCAVAAFILAFHLEPQEFHFAGWFFLPILFLTALQPTWIFQASEKQHFQSALAVIQPALTALLYAVWFRPGKMSAGSDLVVITFVSACLTLIYWRAIFRLTSFRGKFFSLDGLGDAWGLIVKSRWLFLSALAINVYTSLDQPILGWLHSIEELGKYRTAVRVTDAAQGILMILPAVLFPRFIEWRKKGEEFFWKRQLKLTVLGGLGGGVVVLAGFLLIPFCYPFVFGSAYAGAAVPCAILISSKIVEALNQVFSLGLMTDHRYDKTVLFATAVTAVFSLSSNVFLVPKFGMYATAVVNLLSEVLMLGVCFWLALRRIRSIRESRSNERQA